MGAPPRAPASPPLACLVAAALAAFILVAGAAAASQPYPMSPVEGVLEAPAARGTLEAASRALLEALEEQDERRDAEIFRAVVDSMEEWRRRRNAKGRRQARAAGVCYSEVGCFSDSGVFGYLDMLPSPPDEVGTRFLLFPGAATALAGAVAGAAAGVAAAIDVPFANRSAIWGGVPLPAAPDAAPEASKTSAVTAAPPKGDPPPKVVDARAAGPPPTAAPAAPAPTAPVVAAAAAAISNGFNASAPTKVIVHGFGSSCGHVWVYEMRAALMAVEPCNVLCVDWEGGATVPNYVRAAANTRLVGKQLALLLRDLQRAAGLRFSDVHLIGFSLGAHAAGFAGAELRNLSRITGLDPAGPLFEGQDPRARLDASDATFVDVIHSNGENLILGGLGAWQPLGHVDFYPNGGRMQKGCSNLFVGAVTDILWSASEVEGRSLCNHRRAYKFFTDSVSPRCAFPAFPCDSWERFLAGACFPCAAARRCGNMGYYADRSAGRGSLFLVTRDEEPFCAHQYHVRLESAASDPPVTSIGSVKLTLAGAGGINETFVLTQKEDESLEAGGALQRLLVPHPAMREPAAATLLYTAYAGWWSSGLPHWPVRKLALVDSFGKSLSVCRRELRLESGVPVTLPLYPGDCHPPPPTPSPAGSPQSTPPPQPPTTSPPDTAPDAPTPTVAANASSSAEGGEEGGGEATGAELDGVGPFLVPTRVVLAGEDGVEEDPLAALLDPLAQPPRAPASRRPPWHPLEGNSLEDSRAFQSSPVGASANASDIREPVLTPRGAKGGEKGGVEEGAETDSYAAAAAALPDRTGASEDATRLWIPAAELRPPPLGATLPWHSWGLARADADARRAATLNGTAGPAPAPAAPAPGAKRSRSPPAPPTPPAPRTVQLLPQRLAALLAHAERYARMSLAAVTGGGGDPDADAAPDAAASTSPRRPKLFGGGRSALPPPPPPPRATDRHDVDARGDVLVPLSHAPRSAASAPANKFIPVQFPTAPTAPTAEASTVTLEDMKSRFRSVKIERSTVEAPVDASVRPVYRAKDK